MKSFVVIAVLIALYQAAFSQERAKIVPAARIEQSIVIDGVLDEREWSRAQPVDDFIQYDPQEGATPTERTRVFLLYDDDALYIGAVLFDSDPDRIIGQLSRRDRFTHADRFEVMIDSNNDRLTAYYFAVNVSNVQEDGIYSQDGALYDGTWDAVWESSTARSDGGWSVEIRIPYSALRFDKSDGEHRWGINFRRFIARKNEDIQWVVVSREETGPRAQFLISRFGSIHGIRNINPSMNIEILPYVVSQGRRRSDRLPQISERDVTGNIGLDVKFGLTTNTTLDLAVNPDFGQVEIDQSIINLTAFETFYSEKRPFFLEGADLFRFGSTYDGRQMLLFYSRRVGRRPVQPRLERGQSFIEMPQSTTILGAAKLTSRTPGGFSVGTLSALTDSEYAVIRTADGARVRKPIEPRGLYNVFRMRQELLDNSFVGFMATGVLRDGMQTALSGGVDWNLRFGGNEYVVDGFIAGTSTAIDGNQVEGFAGRLYAAKPSGRHWLASANYEFFSRDFNPNDIGFRQRADYQGVWADVYYKDDYVSGIFRRYATRLAAESRWNFDGKPIKQDTQLSVLKNYSNFWDSYISYQYNFSSYDDIETRGWGLYKRPDYHIFNGWVRTDARNPIVVVSRYDVRWADYGMREMYFTLSLDVRPSPSVEISPGAGWFRSKGYEAWFDNIFDDELGGISLFGDRDVDQLDISLRGIVTLHPRLSVQFFTQVLLSKVWYTNPRYLAAPDDLRPYDYEEDHPMYYDPDFNYQGFNANVIMRWEFRPGSTIYVVWTQERYGFLESYRDTFRTPLDNVFLIKFNYWFSV